MKTSKEDCTEMLLSIWFLKIPVLHSYTFGLEKEARNQHTYVYRKQLGCTKHKRCSLVVLTHKLSSNS